MSKQWKDIIKQVPTTIPAGYKTLKELVKELGVTEASARNNINNAVEAGLVDVKKVKLEGYIANIYKIK